MALGRQGEEIAARYLYHFFYEIRAMNVRIGPHDEIDIIAFDPEDQVLVFAEVKTRRGNSAYSPELNWTPKKQKACFRAARAWIDQQEFEGAWRIDLLCIADGQVIEHWKEVHKNLDSPARIP